MVYLYIFMSAYLDGTAKSINDWPAIAERSKRINRICSGNITSLHVRQDTTRVTVIHCTCNMAL